MDARTLARTVALGRLGFGAALISAPERLTAPWLGRDAQRAGTQVAVRGLGVRDMGLAVGALTCAEADLPRWVAAAIAADTTDMLATLAAGDQLPLGGRVLVATIAFGGAALGALAWAGLQARPLRPGPRQPA